jgi:hypothetical protein
MPRQKKHPPLEKNDALSKYVKEGLARWCRCSTRAKTHYLGLHCWRITEGFEDYRRCYYFAAWRFAVPAKCIAQCSLLWWILVYRRYETRATDEKDATQVCVVFRILVSISFKGFLHWPLYLLENLQLFFNNVSFLGGTLY